MKSSIVLALIVLSSTSSALAQNCLGEAQIIAKVETVGAVSSGLCKATVTDIRFFAENLLCPLNVEEVRQSGILVRADNFQCGLTAGDEINGIIVLKEDGSIRLEF